MIKLPIREKRDGSCLDAVGDVEEKDIGGSTQAVGQKEGEEVGRAWRLIGICIRYIRFANSFLWGQVSSVEMLNEWGGIDAEGHCF